MTAAVSFSQVSRHFGAVKAVDAVDLAIAPGEFFAMLGPSGSGKTTCLRLIAGFEQPTSGHIEIFGETAEGVPPYRRHVNTVFQDYALFPHLDILNNVAYGLMVKGVEKSERLKLAGQALELVKLPGYGGRKPGQLSGGQRQRVALARSLAKAPRLLLLDEPLGALDAKLRTATQFELMDIQEKTGTTFVIVTHDQEEAMTVASRVAVMDTGRVIQADTPARIYETPNSVYVADFIGEVTILSGTARKSGAGYEIHYAEGVPPLYAEDEARFDNGETCHIALRPEKVAISAERPEDRRNAVEGTIIDIAYLGNLSTYHVKLATGQMIKAQTANTRRLALRGFTWEDKVWLSWTDTAAVLLKE